MCNLTHHFLECAEKPKAPKGMNFIDLVDNPSVVYITKKASASAIPRKLVGAIWNAWPVLIFALLLSLLSGVLLWFLVSFSVAS